MDTADAILMDATGSVFIERDGKRTALNEGDGIYESDLIITGPDTTAEIVFRDGAKSRLSPDTELTLVDFDFGDGEAPSFVMNLAQGAMRTVSGEVVKLNPEAFELITPRATVGVRGTEFFNAVDGIDETHAVLYITDGNVMLVTRDDGETIELAASMDLIDITGENPGPLNLHKFSILEMEDAINALAPTLGANLPESEEDQGKWAPLDDIVQINDQADSTTSEAFTFFEDAISWKTDATITGLGDYIRLNTDFAPENTPSVALGANLELGDNNGNIVFLDANINAGILKMESFSAEVNSFMKAPPNAPTLFTETTGMFFNFEGKLDAGDSAQTAYDALVNSTQSLIV